MFSYDFFQTQTFKVVSFNIGCSCFFFGNLAVFIHVVEGISGFETVDVLGIVVGFNQGGVGNFFNVGNFCSGSFGFAGCSISFAGCSISFAGCSISFAGCSFGFDCGIFCGFYFGIDALFGFVSYLFGFIGGCESRVSFSVGFVQ